MRNNNLAKNASLGILATIFVLGLVAGIIALDAWVIMLLWGSLYSAVGWPTFTISFGGAVLISLALSVIFGMFN